MAGRKKQGKAGSEDHAFEALLDYLKRNRGFDFTGYKRSTLVRRVSKRMHEVGTDDYVTYQDHLEIHPDEFAFLFNTILINVTAFFRDPAAWEYLAEQVLPAILASRRPEEPIRVWSAGCASGEEAYTLAMLLAEALGEQGFRRRAKIYATDIDEEALAAARRAAYSPREVEAVPEALREKYFERQGTRYAFRPELRRSVIFGRHDLVQDAPISRVDLLVCRNVLMYLNAETQSRVLARLHFGLAPQGYLFLGKAEMLLTHADLFTPVDLKQRVFAKAPGLGMRQQLAALAEAGNVSARTQLEVQEHVLEAALEAAPAAQLVVDASGALALANRAAQELFALTPADFGRPLQDLEISYRPVELRSLIEQAYQEGRTVRVADVERPVRNGDPQYLDVEVTPLRDDQEVAVGASVAFLDRSERTLLRQELDRTREELETTNEELHSGNEELRTMNEQLQVRTEQLHDNQAFLKSVLDSIRLAVVVVDREFRILSWEERMRDLWGLREEEVVGRSLLALDIGLPVEELRPALEACLRGDAEESKLELDAVNRRGTKIRCAVNATPLRQDAEVTGVIVLMQHVDDRSEAADPPRRRGRGRR